MFYNGYHGDCAETHVVGGSVDDRGRALVHTAEECLNRAIQVCGPGQPLREIGRVIRWVTMPVCFLGSDFGQDESVLGCQLEVTLQLTWNQPVRHL